jgi:hypothetical protein
MSRSSQVSRQRALDESRSNALEDLKNRMKTASAREARQPRQSR